MLKLPPANHLGDLKRFSQIPILPNRGKRHFDHFTNLDLPLNVNYS
jgi:hypothetical protein